MNLISLLPRFIANTSKNKIRIPFFLKFKNIVLGSSMAFIELLSKNEIDSLVDSKVSEETATNFITNTLRSLLFSPSVPCTQESENDSKLKHITLQEVSDHDCADDCWIIVYDRVYDVTHFLDEHPGGDNVLMEYAGRDCTIAFRGHSNAAVLSLKKYEIGILPPHQRIYRWPGMIRISESKPE